MGKALRWLLSFVVLIGTACVGGASATAATAADADNGTESAVSTDIRDRILAIPGMSIIEEKPADGYRFFLLNYEQPVDHRDPDAGTFKQRISILHRDEDRPTVFFTSGYDLSEEPRRSEPTQIVDGNQVSMEYRFFTPSRPDPADWSKLDIWQAASDQHRLQQALKRIYDQNWVSTGGSKGGMTATYYRRFYPEDMDGTVAYVAPNNVNNREDSAYDRFFDEVSTPACRARLADIQREALERRDEMVARYEKAAAEEGWTFDLVGSVDRAYEVTVLDLVWGFWQYQEESACADVPTTDVSTDKLYAFVDEIAGFAAYADQGLRPYVPYYYQAGTELGQPDVRTPHLRDLLRYPGINTPRSFVPRDIPMEFDKRAMRDIDKWVRTESSEMLFVYGENDPWGAEPFRLGEGSSDGHVYTAPGANHGADIAGLRDDERRSATSSLLEWADVRDDPGVKAHTRRLTEPHPQLDQQPLRDRALRP
ncbi:S28 family serine protease [Streptomyces oceani]|uniref:Aminopeptidase n=1 Tax=Streptomyces oceani TaxID=1075402 RepID=A0A1E7KFW2_9ACTN|nr:S28 family serine protease [Streptomyces oceani]OEV02796.1 aminopeptidase [Streptomyces oceani]